MRARVEVDRPGGGVELGDVARREELRRGVRAFEGADLPVAGDVRAVRLGDGSCGRPTPAPIASWSPGRSGTPVVPPMRPRSNVAADPSTSRDVQTAPDQQVRAHARRPGAPIASTPPAGTSTGSHCGTGTSSSVTAAGAPVTMTVAPVTNRSSGPAIVHSRPGAPSGLPSARVAQPERQVVHRPRRRDADVPQARATGPVLDRREHARAQHLDARGLVVQVRERARVVQRGRDLGGVHDRAEQARRSSRCRSGGCSASASPSAAQALSRSSPAVITLASSGS